MGFEQLPNRITGPLPEIYRPVPVPAPPVYDTTAMIQPLMKLADYLSPEKRALRQAMIAKANADWRDSQPRGREDQMWYFKLQQHKNTERRAQQEEARSAQRFAKEMFAFGVQKEEYEYLRQQRVEDKALEEKIRKKRAKALGEQVEE